MKNKILWGLQILVALAFLAAGVGKLVGGQEVVEFFDRIGLGQWFRYFTAGCEIAGAVLLLVPRLCGFGALLLVCVMVGAIITHLFVVGGNPIAAIVFLAVTAYIVLERLRWNSTAL